MIIKHYPLLLIIQNDIEYIDTQSRFEISLYNIDKKEFDDIFVIYQSGECHLLSSPAPIELCFDKLTKIVQNTLLHDGQCCVDKIRITHICQAFDLLKNTE
jgi:hypothetical protein